MVRPGSAAWVTAILAILMFLTGGLLITSLDPVMQAILGSELWTSSTTQGTEALKWQARMWAFVPVSILLAILFEIWITTRQPQ